MKTNPFAFLLDQIENNLPAGLQPLKEEVRNTLRAMLEEKIAALDFVPRAEFEAQLAILAAAEERIAALESQLAEREKDNPANVLPAPQ